MSATPARVQGLELRDLDDNDRKEADDLAYAILAALDGAP